MTPNDKAQRGKGSKKVKEGLVMGFEAFEASGTRTLTARLAAICRYLFSNLYFVVHLLCSLLDALRLWKDMGRRTKDARLYRRLSAMTSLYS